MRYSHACELISSRSQCRSPLIMEGAALARPLHQTALFNALRREARPRQDSSSNKASGKRPEAVYPCADCHCWHLTFNDRRDVAAGEPFSAPNGCRNPTVAGRLVDDPTGCAVSRSSVVLRVSQLRLTSIGGGIRRRGLVTRQIQRCGEALCTSRCREAIQRADHLRKSLSESAMLTTARKWDEFVVDHRQTGTTRGGAQ